MAKKYVFFMLYIFVFFLLSCTSGSDDVSLNQEIKKQSSLSVVKFDFNLLKSDISTQSQKQNLYILLPDGKKAYLEKTKIEYRENGFTWFGKIKGKELSSVVITVEKGTAFGTLNINGEKYRIEPFSVEEGLYKIESLKGKKAVPFFEDTVPFFQKKIIDKNVIKPQVSYEDGSRVDILILYTQKLEDEYGSGITSLAQHLIDITNNAYSRSGISTRLHIAGVVKFSDSRADESVDPNSALSYITNNQTVRDLRESYKADLVTLLRKYTGGSICGLAYMPVRLPSDFEQNLDYYVSAYKNSGFSVVNVGSSGIYYCYDTTLAHEVGHNFGCSHDRDHASGEGAFSYSYGYDIPGSFATIMSYDTPKIEYFSNPNILYNGESIGKPEGDPEAAYNAKTINKTDIMIANYINRNENNTPTKPVITVTPTKIDFGSIEVGKSKSSYISVLNTGGGTLSISSISITGSGDFFITDDNCSEKSLSANTSCRITVVFKPLNTGAKLAVISINSNAENNQKVNVSLTGIGTEPSVAEIYVNPKSLSFGYLYRGQTKKNYITVKNQSKNSYLQLSFDILPSDDFTVVHNCPSYLSTLSYCTITVIFNPQHTGPLNYSFTIKSNDPNKPSIKIPVSGYSLRNPPKIDVSRDSIDFGEVYLGEKKVEKLVIKNKGDKDLIIDRMYIDSKDFSYIGNCQVIKGNQECSIDLIFKPETEGIKNGKLYIYSNADNVNENPIFISLAGKGKKKPKPVIVINTSPIDFGKTIVGNPVIKEIRIKNTGNKELLLNASTDNTAFTVIAQCENVKPNSECNIRIKFIPDKTGKITGRLLLTTNDPQKPEVSISLKGEGLPIPKPHIDISKKDVDFGKVIVGKEKQSSIKVKNSGNADLYIFKVEISDDQNFKVYYKDCKTLKASESCLINISFTPKTEGVITAKLTVFTNDEEKELIEINLKGESLPVPKPVIKLNKSKLDFGEVQIGRNLEKEFTIKNEGNADLNITDIIVSDGNNFSVKTSCSVIKPDDICSVSVIFHPTQEGNIKANLVIYSNSGNIGVSLKGKGLSEPKPKLTLLTDNLDFGEVFVGDNIQKSITIKNTGNAPLNIYSIEIKGDKVFSIEKIKTQSKECSVLKPDGKCKITVVFKPTEEKQYSGKLFIQSDDIDKPPVEVSLTGLGVYRPQLSIDFDSSDFGTVFIGDEETKKVILENKGKGKLYILNVNLNSSSDEFFIEDNNCPDILKSEEKCQIKVSFKPETEGKKKASLIIETGNMDKWNIAFVGKGKRVTAPQIDIDKDGKVTYKDVKKAVEKVLLKEKVIDLNGDNDSDISDIILFLRAVKTLERLSR